ncbi:hypothetical protein [Kitasatospora griseola]|uniref:hypothetical protein n=1 Tax=Kitasatospora griseola TaxID=2064 RepID=UPI0016710DE2|nr:hypothetical protein [Kitasatospora griseola]GGR07676.1 hypothetical protein GCM10010195_73190 [Kitasatospora griseola]
MTLKVTTTGGTGTAHLYYTASSTKSGTDQSITVTSTTAGYRYITLYGKTAFSGATVTTQH